MSIRCDGKPIRGGRKSHLCCIRPKAHQASVSTLTCNDNYFVGKEGSAMIAIGVREAPVWSECSKRFTDHICLYAFLLNGSFLAQVTGSVESLGLYEEQGILEENVDGKAEEGEEEEAGGVRVGEGDSEVKANLEDPHVISLTVTQDCSGSPPPSLPSMITLPLLRDSEREVMVRKASILHDDKENVEDCANTSLSNCSHNTSQLVSHDSSVLDLSLFSYSTPEMLRVVSSRRSPRVLLPKIRIPDFLLGDKETHKNNGSEGDCSEEEGDEHLNEEVPIQSPIEEELLVYEERRREEALRRQQERKKRFICRNS